jgi:hypothetical protein
MEKQCCGCDRLFKMDCDTIHCISCDRFFCYNCYTAFNDEAWGCESFREEFDNSPRGKYGEIEWDSGCDYC